MAGLTGFNDIGWELVCKATRSLSKNVILPPMEPIHCNPLFYQCLLEIQNEQVIRFVFHDVLLPAQIMHRGMSIQRKNQVHYNFSATARTLFDCYAIGILCWCQWIYMGCYVQPWG